MCIFKKQKQFLKNNFGAHDDLNFLPLYLAEALNSVLNIQIMGV